MDIKFFSRTKHSKLISIFSFVLVAIFLCGCLFPTDYLVLERGGWAPGTTNQLPQYKVFWPTQNSKFTMFCFKNGFQGSVPSNTNRAAGGWLLAFNNGLYESDATQQTAILNEIAFQDSTATLYTGKWGQGSKSIYAPQFERQLDASSYCFTPPQIYPNISGCNVAPGCYKAELFAATFDGSGNANLLPVFSTNTMNTCVLNSSEGNTVAAWIHRATVCPQQRVLQVYLKR